MNNEQKAKAKYLYFQTDMSKTQIADKLRIPRRTLYYWIQTNNWDKLKTSSQHMPALLAEKCYHMMARVSDHILSEERDGEPITYREANTIHKLTITINKLKNRATLNENMEMFGYFMDNMFEEDPDLAEKVSPFVDKFIESHARRSISEFTQRNKRTFTPEEEFIEKQLDLDDEEAWAKENPPTDETMNEEPYVPYTPDITYPGTRVQRRENLPTHEELIAELQRQNDNVRHLFTVNPRFKLPKAA